jgi:proteasome lid subunit RPN8/RPN11
VEHLEKAYPHEGCGVILRGPHGFRVERIDNAYDRLHAEDPAAFPRSARTAYAFDPRRWLEVSLEADRRGETVACVYHSHCDAPAGFSAEDRARAAPEGSPLLPGALYLVLAVQNGAAAAARICWWSHGVFEEADFPMRLKAN